MSRRIVGFAACTRGDEPKVVWFEENDPLEVALAGLESIGVDSDSVRALGGSTGVAKAAAALWPVIFAPR